MYRRIVGKWSGDVNYKGQSVIINAVLWQAEQSFGYQTKMQQVPVWFRELTENGKRRIDRTRSMKTKDAWIETFIKHLQPIS